MPSQPRDACTLACALAPGRDDCTEDCTAARRAAAEAAQMLAATTATGCYWAMEFHLAASPPGQVRLQPAGDYPAGRTPRAFCAAWWRAVAKAAEQCAQECEAEAQAQDEP